jgi:hypothetical protein
MKLSDTQLIDLLGGSGKVAKLCKVSPASVTHWKTRGIPMGHLVIIAARLEKESYGLITRQDMFPGTFLEIWPELSKENLVSV